MCPKIIIAWSRPKRQAMVRKQEVRDKSLSKDTHARRGQGAMSKHPILTSPLTPPLPPNRLKCECEYHGHGHAKHRASQLMISHDEKRRKPSAPQWIGTIPLYLILIMMVIFLYGAASALTTSTLLIGHASSGSGSRRKQARLRKQKAKADRYQARAEERHERNKQWMADGGGLIPNN